MLEFVKHQLVMNGHSFFIRGIAQTHSVVGVILMEIREHIACRRYKLL